jgi:P-type E1-E2 ATPase
VTSFDTSGDRDGTGGAALAVAAGLAQGATHHLSASILRYAHLENIPPMSVTQVRTSVGKGVVGWTRVLPPSGKRPDASNVVLVDGWNERGDVLANGGEPTHVESAAADGELQVSLGSPAFMESQGLSTCTPLQMALERHRNEGRPIACVGWGGRVRAVFAFTEDIRAEAPGVLEELKRHGVALFMLTGDHAQRARQLAGRLGLEAEAELLPADKIARVNALAATSGPVAMVGDGINDAPALAAADVGIAMGCGADVTRESADVTLAGNDLQTLAWARDLSVRTVRVIKQNLFWAFAYNTAGIALAFAGKLSPIFAAIAMVVSSLLVVTNSLRLNSQDQAQAVQPRHL